MAQRITLGELLHQLAHKYQDRPAITEVGTGTQYSYIELERFTNQIAHGFWSCLLLIMDMLALCMRTASLSCDDLCLKKVTY